MIIRVRNFRGCESAGLVCDPIALVAGKNAVGKSSIAQAAGAVLTGEVLPFGLATKAAAASLVTSGADAGFVEIGADNGGARIDWPSCTHATKGEPPRASKWAAGLDSVANLSAKERAQVLAQYLHADPTREDVAAALADAELGDEPIVTAVWKLITDQGWDAAHTRRRDVGVELKGRWRQITNTNWGSRIGASWRPPDWTLNLDAIDEPEFEADIETAKSAHEAAIGSAAVSAARRAEMAAEAAQLEGRKDTLLEAEQAAEQAAERHSAALQARAALPPGNIDTGLPCPHCGAMVVIRQVNLATRVLEAADPRITDSELKKRRLAVAAADGEVSRLQSEMTAANSALDLARARLQQSAEAANKLKMFPEADTAGADVGKAAQALDAAENRLRAWRQVRDASDVHDRIVTNERVLAILAADGLRARKLTAVVELFNHTLAGDSETADWAPVALAADMALTYGGRLYSLCSTSEQYRVRAVLALAMARIDQSAMIVFDAADVLDGATRGGLFAMLAETGIPALVTMTLTRREQVPDLAAAGLGASYWVENGVCTALAPAKEAA